MAAVQAGGAALSVEIRLCHGIDEFNLCVDLQREVWGFSDLDLVPLVVDVDVLVLVPAFLCLAPSLFA